MNTTSRIITGSIAFVFGIVLIIVSFSVPWLLIHGIPLTIVGIYIFFNKKEDEIEQIKTDSGGGKK